MKPLWGESRERQFTTESTGGTEGEAVFKAERQEGSFSAEDAEGKAVFKAERH